MQFSRNDSIIQNEGSLLAANKVIRQAYALVGLSLLPTIFGVWVGFMLNSLPLRIAMNSPIMYFIIVMAGFYGFIFGIEKNRRNSTGLVLMFVFTFFMGLILQPLIFMVGSMSNGMSLISTAVVGTAAIFLGLAVIGNNTSKDYSFMARYASLLGIILMAGVVLNYFFLKMPTFSLIMSFAFIGFSSMIIVWRINMAARGGEDSYISLALDIYIALYNIFTSLLRILAIFNND